MVKRRGGGLGKVRGEMPPHAKESTLRFYKERYFNVLACAAVQVKNALDATIALGGENYVFWGGREGYMTSQYPYEKRTGTPGRFLHMAKDYARKHGFKGWFFIDQNPWNPPNTSMILMRPRWLAFEVFRTG